MTGDGVPSGETEPQVSVGAGSGRPRIQETADRAVAQLLAVAGDRVDGPSFSTRALAERTGFSQTVVSRAVRRIADGADGRVADGSRTGGAERAAPAVKDAIPAERVEEPLLLTGLEVDESVCRAEFAAAPPQARVRRTRGHLRRRAALLATLRSRGVLLPCELPARLARSIEIPIELVEVLARRDRGGPVSWRAGEAEAVGLGDPVGPAGSAELVADHATAWLPRAGVSVTEQLAVRLRDAIVVSDLRPGDRLTIAQCARLLEVPRSVASDVLRRMVDDELLDGAGGEVRIPLASADDVIELYAARMLLGDVLLRAAAGRPRSHLLRARQVLSVIEEAVAVGANVGDADLRFQQEVARASGLEQTVRLLESSTVRVQMLIALLGMDYARAGRSILADDRQILAALVADDAGRAVEAWHRKTDAAVRHMHGQARHAAFDVQLWKRLTAL